MATWRAFMRWKRELRLFAPGPVVIDMDSDRDVLEEAYGDLAVGVVARLDSDYHRDFSSLILVGHCYGIRNGGLGRGLAIGSLLSSGSTTYRSPDLIEFIHPLGGIWQKVLDMRLARERRSWEDVGFW